MDNSNLKPITMQQIQENPLLNSIFAPYLSPGVQLQQEQSQIPLTQQETATSAQSQQTSAQEQQTSAAQQANLQAENPGVQATAKIEQVKALQSQAPINLGKDLQKGMTLTSAFSKYKPLGLSADDIFNSYLANSRYGTPKETPDQLMQKGVTPSSLGQIGTPGSFLDKYNQRNAIEGVRNAESLWNKITPQDIVQYKLTGKNTSVNNYLSAKQTIGEHLTSLIPGASGAQATGQANISLLPDPGDLRNYGKGIATGAFDTLENSLLTMKNYTPQELGLSSKGKQKENNTGGELLNNILDTVKTSNDKLHNPLGFLATAALKTSGNDAIDTYNNVITDSAKTPNTPTGALQKVGILAKDTITPQHVVGDAATALGARYAPTIISKILGEGGGQATDAIANKVAQNRTSANIPSDLMTKLHPQGTMNAGRNLKNIAINFIDKNKIPISGDSINAEIQAEKGNLYKQFSGISKADVDQALENIENSFKGENLTASQAEKIYNGIPNGFTRTGFEKEDFNSQLAQLKRQAISSAVEKAAPEKGWAQGVQAQAKAFKAEKGQLAKTKNNVLPRAVGAGLGIAGLDTIRHVLGL